MIRIVQNDILQAKENIIAHQVNTQNIKSDGLAKKVWRKWPEGSLLTLHTHKQLILNTFYGGCRL
ncbi:hypothetical protein [Paenibacillus polymyxa]|uniref:hypothetical protein n=1 Tax=Paenibacillus polymyxa TaxID=1406 RepID=UPI0023F7C389|nr:hypothetical protein [Paenibacillus polymyxa]